MLNQAKTNAATPKETFCITFNLNSTLSSLCNVLLYMVAKYKFYCDIPTNLYSYSPCAYFACFFCHTIVNSIFIIMYLCFSAFPVYLYCIISVVFLLNTKLHGGTISCQKLTLCNVGTPGEAFCITLTCIIRTLHYATYYLIGGAVLFSLFVHVLYMYFLLNTVNPSFRDILLLKAGLQ